MRRILFRVNTTLMPYVLMTGLAGFAAALSAQAMAQGSDELIPSRGTLANAPHPAAKAYLECTRECAASSCATHLANAQCTPAIATTDAEAWAQAESCLKPYGTCLSECKISCKEDMLEANGSGEEQPEVDLTGSWQGVVICDRRSAGGDLAAAVEERRTELLIVQDGNIFRMTDASVIRESGDGSQAGKLLYEGVLLESSGKAHEEAAVAGVCGGDYAAQELVRLERIRVADEKSSFYGRWVLLTEEQPDFEEAPVTVTCRSVHLRVSTAAPELPKCARAGVPIAEVDRLLNYWRDHPAGPVAPPG